MLASANNSIAFLIPAPPEETCVFKFNPKIQSYDMACYSQGFWDDDSLQILPGQSFELMNPGAAFTLPFSGEVIPIAAPEITVQPENQTVVVGSNVTFSVTASGQAPLSYQWFFNGNAIPGANDPDLLLSNVGLTEAGSYHVVVNNSGGAATSTVAVLTLDNPEITFADANLEAGVRDALTKAMGPIFLSDMLGLTALDLISRGIVELSGLESARNLQLLDLDFNQVSCSS
jgi:hypothetical protein